VISELSTLGDFHFTAQYFWGIPLYRPVLLGISTLPFGTFGDFHFTARWMEKRRFPTLQPSSKTTLSVQA